MSPALDLSMISLHSFYTAPTPEKQTDVTLFTYY